MFEVFQYFCTHIRYKKMRKFALVIFNFLALVGHCQYNLDLVNSAYDEQHPVITPDGNKLFFTRANHPDNVGGTTDKGDIWQSTLTGNSWSTPMQAGTVINNSKWNGVLGFSSNGTVMLLHHHYQDNKQGLSISQKTSNGWTSPVVLKIPYFLNRSTFQSGSISSDGQLIVLSIESYNTKGGEDIYVLFRKRNGTWSDPKNLGRMINTPYQELSPYIAEDNKTLFFASNGHINSKGSFDIYRTTRKDDTWTNWSVPENVGQEINSEGRESSYQYFSNTGIAVYVSTLDSDGYGDFKSVKRNDDIEKPVFAAPDTVNVKTEDTFSVAPIVRDSISTIHTVLNFAFTGTVKSAKTDSILNATLLLTATERNLQVTRRTNDGTFSISLPIGRYHLGVEAKGYLSKFLTIHVDSVVTKHHITMSPIIVGETVNLNSVLFSRGTDELLSSSYDELDAVVKMMEENSSMEILLGGHTDNQGSSKLNYNLSEKRMVAVKKYLQSKGISGKRIDGKGYGGSKPIASNKNEETRKFNRRVEFTVTKK